MAVEILTLIALSPGSSGLVCGLCQRERSGALRRLGSVRPMPLRVTRRSIGRWVPVVVLVAVVVAITAISLSSSVTQWWDVQSTPATSSLPTAADPVLRARPDSANAYVHVVLWFVAGVALVWAMRPYGWRRLAVAAGSLWAYSGLLEIAQRWVPERTSQWIDLVGNAIGIAGGLAAGYAVVGISTRLRRRHAPT